MRDKPFLHGTDEQPCGIAPPAAAQIKRPDSEPQRRQGGILQGLGQRSGSAAACNDRKVSRNIMSLAVTHAFGRLREEAHFLRTKHKLCTENSEDLKILLQRGFDPQCQKRLKQPPSL